MKNLYNFSITCLLCTFLCSNSFGQSAATVLPNATTLTTNGTNQVLNISNTNSNNNNPIVGISSNGTNNTLSVMHSGSKGGAAIFKTIYGLVNGFNLDPTLISINNFYGSAGYFETTDPVNPSPTLRVLANGSGTSLVSINTGSGGYAGFFQIANAQNPGDALIIKTVSNFGSAGSFQISNTGNGKDAVYAQTNGAGSSVYGFNEGRGKAGNFQISNALNTSDALYSTTNGTGKAANFQISNASNSSDALYSTTNGTGKAANFQISNASNSSDALYSTTNGIGNAITGLNNGSGRAANFQISNASNGSEALYTQTNGAGRAAYFQISNASNGNEVLYLQTNGSGNTIACDNIGTGRAGLFQTYNPSNTSPALLSLTYGLGSAGNFLISNTSNATNALLAVTNGTGNALLANYTGSTASSSTAGNIAIFQAASVNVARIDKTGKGYFNGGTQSSGADVAEVFDIEGERNTYEAGDVLIISETSDRKVEKSNTAYSNLVAGVYATKPGVLLSPESIDADISGKVPMGVIGVIPTKVCNEGGSIKRGDLLVTSSKNGFAMKADRKKLEIGQAIGKALQDFDGIEGKIEVLVNVR